MVGGEFCIDRATFSLYLWRKAIQAQANPAASSFLLQPCTAGAGVTDPGFRHQPSGGVLTLCQQLQAPWSCHDCWDGPGLGTSQG